MLSPLHAFPVFATGDMSLGSWAVFDEYSALEKKRCPVWFGTVFHACSCAKNEGKSLCWPAWPRSSGVHYFRLMPQCRLDVTPLRPPWKPATPPTDTSIPTFVADFPGAHCNPEVHVQQYVYIKGIVGAPTPTSPRHTARRSSSPTATKLRDEL